MVAGFMHWIVASLVSACFLGLYELSTKHAVRDNAVLPVLFLCNLCSALLWGGAMVAQRVGGAVAWPDLFVVDPLTAHQHLLLFAKSALVASSWLCVYFAVKHLPVSLASPVRATGPMWTLVGALFVLGERPSTLEIVGIATTLLSFIGLSLAGQREGIHFHRNGWIGWLIAGTVLSAGSALYDKFLLGAGAGGGGFRTATVQAWFSIYLALIFFPLVVGWKLRWWPRNTFQWRWSVIAISLTLLVADFIYFSALREPGAMISIVSSLRRGSTVVAFLGGLWLFGEVANRQKILATVGVLVGIVLTLAG